MEFIDYDWNDVAGTFVKEGLLGSDFSFSTKTDLTHTVDYLPKNQARKLYTYAKEQLDLIKNPVAISNNNESSFVALEDTTQPHETIEEAIAEEVTSFTEIIPANSTYHNINEPVVTETDNGLASLSKDQLFEKLQNYKKLLDNGLILQGEYDKLKNEILLLL